MTQDQTVNVLAIAIAIAILASTFTVLNVMIMMTIVKLYTEFFKQLAQERRR